MDDARSLELYRTMRARVARPRALSGRSGVSNLAGPIATVRLYDEIGYFGITAEDIARQVEQITADEIEVQINSPGGEVFDGIAIYNVLRAHPAKVTTRVDGIAASAASVVAQAGDRRVMLSAGQMMIHEAWGVAIGPAAELRAFADVLDQQNDVLAGIYASRSGRDVDEMRSLMATETWLTDAQAVDAGLADEVIDPGGDDPEARASLDEIAAAFQRAIARCTETPAAPSDGPDASDPGADPNDAEASDTDLLRALHGALT